MLLIKQQPKIKWLFISLSFIVIMAGGIFGLKESNLIFTKKVGEKIDSFNGVNVYFNGEVGNIEGRNLTSDNYNLGLKYQCVEFVKRYYYKHLNHKMPNSYGHAKDFFNPNIKDGQMNTERNLVQFTNLSTKKPKVDDLLVFSATSWNPYGHVAIISKVNDSEIEIVQQNVGNHSRKNLTLRVENGKWKIDNLQILGWLRKL